MVFEEDWSILKQFVVLSPIWEFNLHSYYKEVTKSVKSYKFCPSFGQSYPLNSEWSLYCACNILVHHWLSRFTPVIINDTPKCHVLFQEPGEGIVAQSLLHKERESKDRPCLHLAWLTLFLYLVTCLCKDGSVCVPIHIPNCCLDIYKRTGFLKKYFISFKPYSFQLIYNWQFRNTGNSTLCNFDCFIFS